MAVGWNGGGGRGTTPEAAAPRCHADIPRCWISVGRGVGIGRPSIVIRARNHAGGLGQSPLSLLAARRLSYPRSAPGRSSP